MSRAVRKWGGLGAAAVLLLAGALVASLLVHSGGRPATAATSGGLAASTGDGGAGAGASGSGGSASGASGSGAGSARDPVTVSVAAAGGGRRIPAGFLGFSFEFQAVRSYTGDNPRQINPVLVQLIRNLTPGQAPVLRIGGDSTDVSYVPGRGVRPPPFVDYPLTPSWMATTAALQRQLGAKLILGLNLAANQPRLAAAEARAFTQTFEPGAITGLEIGNEPNVYHKSTVYSTVLGIPVAARPAAFGYPEFRREFDAIARAAPGPTLAGPALAIGPSPGPGSWVQTMSNFLSSDQRVAMMTVHRYPLRNCYVPPQSPQYPSIAHLLSSYATVQLAASLKRWVQIAHGQHRVLRVDELNSVACRGKTGVSDTFASALWVTDALFSLAHAGVDGIDMHTLPDAAYELFQFSHQNGRWSAFVRPVYYGLQLFAQAAPAGARLLKVRRRGADTGLSAWATRAPDGSVRVVLINKDTSSNRTVRLALGGNGATAASVERMQAPSVSAGSGVTLGGSGYGSQTFTGVLAPAHTQSVAITRGKFTVSVPRGSAALVTVPATAG